MTEYKLHYFNVTGLGEPIRFLFHYGGIEFEDIRYSAEDWLEAKKSKYFIFMLLSNKYLMCKFNFSDMPFGQMPVLEIDGEKIAQSNAICRYLAKLVGLGSDNEFESMQIDSVVDSFNDLRLSKYEIHMFRVLED
jgi:hypothetical protein